MTPDIAETRIRTLRTIEHISLDGVSARTLAQWLHGRTFAGMHRHGKHLAAELDSGGALMLHFGMTDALRYAKGTGPITAHSRMVVAFDNGYRVTCGSQRLLGSITLTADVDAFHADAHLGPDALHVNRAFAARMAKRRGMIKSTLMNQSVIAGLDNLYTDETLYTERSRCWSPAASRHRHRTADGLVARCFTATVLDNIQSPVDPGMRQCAQVLVVRKHGSTPPGQ